MAPTGDETIPDGWLVARSLDGERNAFGRLYDRYARLVRAIVYDAARHYAAAEDLTQEVFMRAYRRLGTLREPDRFGPWLVGIARQVGRESRRKKRRETERIDHAGLTMAAKPAEHEDRFAAAEEAELIWSEVAKLPEQERLAVQVFYLNGENASETARLLDLSRSGVYAVLARACRRLAVRLRSLAPERSVMR
jgi:RNA polymerase sigma-70 factor (ECF subfamily)